MFKVFINFIDFLSIRLTEPSHYTALFKGAIVMLTLRLVLLNQLSPLNTLEKNALKSKYITEMQLGKNIKDFDAHKCDVKVKTYVDCKMAKAQLTTLDSSINLLVKLLQNSIYLAFSMLALSIYGYIGSAVMDFRKKT